MGWRQVGYTPNVCSGSRLPAGARYGGKTLACPRCGRYVPVDLDGRLHTHAPILAWPTKRRETMLLTTPRRIVCRICGSAMGGYSSRDEHEVLHGRVPPGFKAAWTRRNGLVLRRDRP